MTNDERGVLALLIKAVEILNDSRDPGPLQSVEIAIAGAEWLLSEPPAEPAREAVAKGHEDAPPREGATASPGSVERPAGDTSDSPDAPATAGEGAKCECGHSEGMHAFKGTVCTGIEKIDHPSGRLSVPCRCRTFKPKPVPTEAAPAPAPSPVEGKFATRIRQLEAERDMLRAERDMLRAKLDAASEREREIGEPFFFAGYADGWLDRPGNILKTVEAFDRFLRYHFSDRQQQEREP